MVGSGRKPLLSHEFFFLSVSVCVCVCVSVNEREESVRVFKKKGMLAYLITVKESSLKQYLYSPLLHFVWYYNWIKLIDVVDILGI